MNHTLRNFPLLGALAVLAACSGGVSGSDAPEDVLKRAPVDSQIFTVSDISTLAALRAIATEPGTGNSVSFVPLSGSFGYKYGQVPGEDAVVAAAGFSTANERVSGGMPTGTVSYNSVARFEHITDIGTDDAGNFSTGTATRFDIPLTFNVAFSESSFSGSGTSDDGQTLAMDGAVSGSGNRFRSLDGTATFAGITADLEGQVYGNSSFGHTTAVVGAFSGQSDSGNTAILVGGFTGFDVIE